MSTELPRLLILNTTNRRRGAEVQSVRIGEELERRGWSVELVSLTSEPNDPTIDARTLTGRSPDSLGRLNLDVGVSILRLLSNTRYDLVLANGSATLRYVATFGRLVVPRRRIGYISIGDMSYWARTRSARIRMGVLLKAVGWVLAVSDASAKQIRELGGPSMEVDVVYSGVPSSFLEVDGSARDGPLHVVVIGSLSREKDPETAVRVLATASEDALLRFVGSGPLAEEVSASARRLGVADRVELVGPRASIVGDLEWADVLLLTSRTEGLPGVVLEAAAAGVPTIGFDVGGTAEIIDDRSTGRVISAGDVRAMTEALAELEAQENLRQEWGENARAVVRDRYLLEHAAERYDQALRRRLTAES